MRTVLGVALLASLVLVGEPPPAVGETYTEGLVASKDDMSKGDWDGNKKWESKPPASTPSTPGNAGPVPPSGGSGGTPTPTGGTTDDGGTTGGDGGTTAGGGGDLPGPGVPHTGGDEEEEDEGGVDVNPGGDGGTTNPEPEPAPLPPLKPAPLPACSGKFVLKEKQATPELVSEQTLLTNLLFRNDAFAYISNGYCRSESTWFLDAFAKTSVGHEAMKEYEVEVILEGGCGNCAPYFRMDGTSYLDTRARVRTSWGGIDAGSLAKASASTVWSGLLDCADSCEASVENGWTGEELKLAASGVEVKVRGSRSDVSDSMPAGKADHEETAAKSIWMKVTNKAEVKTDAYGTENNSQAKARVGETMKFEATTKCGASAKYELTLIAR